MIGAHLSTAAGERLAWGPTLGRPHCRWHATTIRCSADPIGHRKRTLSDAPEDGLYPNHLERNATLGRGEWIDVRLRMADYFSFSTIQNVLPFRAWTTRLSTSWRPEKKTRWQDDGGASANPWQGLILWSPAFEPAASAVEALGALEYPKSQVFRPWRSTSAR